MPPRPRSQPRAASAVAPEVLEQALAHLVRGIVAHPDAVDVHGRPGRRGPTLEVHVHPDDLGKVIGRAGRTARALRTVMAALGGPGARVEVVDAGDE